jgi:hypothetical protein
MSGTAAAALPLGSDAGKGLFDAFGVRLPMLIEAGSFLDERFYLGGFVGTSVGSGISSDSDGWHGVLQLGLATEYRLVPEGRVVPWLGYAAGIEWSSTGPGKYFVNATGFELARVTAGVDFRGSETGPRDRAAYIPGLYIDFALLDYTNMSAVGRDASQAKLDQSMHMWASIGLRMAYMP